jgi:uncharacterized protein (DUF305 family)
VGTRLAALVLLLVVSGCAPRPEAPARANNATDVMFLQMGLAQIDEGDDLATLVASRAGDPALRSLATDLGTQWLEEDGTMRRWLLGWQQPLTPGAGTDHAGHGDLHTLRPADLADLKTRKNDFDRTAVGLLLSHLGNCVETSRMETAGSAYPPARALARTITERRQSQVRDLLTMAARGTD